MRLRRLLVPSGGLASVALLVVIVSPFGTSCNNVATAATTAAPTPAGALTAGQLVRFFESGNWSPNASGGIVGNMAQEDSSFDPRAAGGGLVQNIGSKWDQQVAFDQQHNLDPNSYSGQLEFLLWFVPRQSWWTRFDAAPTPQDAALWFQNGYEQCSGAGQSGTDQTGGGLCNPTNRMTQAAAALAAAGGSSAVPIGTGGCASGAGGYVNPYSHLTGERASRIDMGVDTDGQGEIDAMGRALITFAGVGIGGKWTCSNATNGGVVYQLLDGAYAGKYVYVAEDVSPVVSAGETVQAGQRIATMSGCDEMGWADPAAANSSVATVASTLPGFSGDQSPQALAMGDSMDRLLRAVGDVGGRRSGAGLGAKASTPPAGYP